MRSPRDFFRPLALGAPQPLHDIPVRPSRMIHFFDPSNPKMVEKAPGIAKRVDIQQRGRAGGFHSDSQV
jgi:malyl-CoA/(S)-citramalyl-CoA lyase